jgi:vacuolar-type H+-ATPase catalytic subunit A/Vma1
MNDTHYEIHGVNGPVVTVTGGRGLAMQDMVRVGDWNLTGEVVRVEDGVATVQVYEDTTGLAPGQQVTSMGGPLSVELGPGLLTNIFDGIARPLKVIQDQSGPFISRGLNIPSRPLITGQRVIDTLFPIAKGGAAAIPGGFGAGKTMTQHQLAKWCDADIIVYVGCGERGNEMTQVLEEFSELLDPKRASP